MTATLDPGKDKRVLPRRLGLPTASFVVVASMIGTGVFTTTGLLVEQLASPGAVLVVWAVGGMLALCGALAYAELAACISSNGGEYRFLSEIYHPAVGFVAGWLSLVVGFSAPIAASALAFGKYLHAILPWLSPTLAAVVLVLLLSVLHAARVTTGAWIQNGFTAAKVLLIVAFVAGAAWRLPDLSLERLSRFGPGAGSGHLAVALILVSFAYSGFNGAVYLSGEIRRPTRNLPLALGLGTALVVVLYVTLNATFLLSADPKQISGTIEVGHLAAVSLFGAGIGTVFTALIALVLVSSVSAMIMVGPRVYEAMGEDYRALRFLRMRREAGGPIWSVALQAGLATILVLTLGFETLLIYIGVTLSASAALTVAGVFVFRRRRPDVPRPYRTLGYPWIPAAFVLFAGWVIVYTVVQRPIAALLGGASIMAGLLLYFGVAHQSARRTASSFKGDLK